MAFEFILFLRVVFFFTELLIYERVCYVISIDCLYSDLKRDSSELWWKYATKNNSKEMLSIGIICLLSNCFANAVLNIIIK